MVRLIKLVFIDRRKKTIYATLSNKSEGIIWSNGKSCFCVFSHAQLLLSIPLAVT